MSDSEKKPELVFMPGCFDNFEGTQEELAELIGEITAMFESGEMEANAVAVDFDELFEEDPEVAEEIFAKLEQNPDDRTLH
jgi:hypothetical protein